MALDSAGLEDALLDLFESPSETPHDAAVSFAAVYAAYSADGMFGASTVTIDGARESAFATTFEGGLVVSPTPAGFLAALSSGVATFWTGAPVVGAQSGLTNGCPGAASLPAALAALMANPANTAEVAAAGYAAALHTATLTVQATVSPPPATVLPIA
jgi:hypothetical protein